MEWEADGGENSASVLGKCGPNFKKAFKKQIKFGKMDLLSLIPHFHIVKQHKMIFMGFSKGTKTFDITNDGNRCESCCSELIINLLCTRLNFGFNLTARQYSSRYSRQQIPSKRFLYRRLLVVNMAEN